MEPSCRSRWSRSVPRPPASGRRRGPLVLRVAPGLALVLAASIGAGLAHERGLLAEASAADAPRAAPPAWQREVEDGIAAQDAELARGNPKAVVARYESRASRVGGVPALYLLARAFGKAGDHANALTTYAEVLREDPRMWYALRDRGVLRLLAKDVPGAEADLRAAVAVQPRYVEALQPLADLLMETKRHEEAVRVLSRVLDLEPTRDSARSQLVAAYAAWGRPDDALVALDILIRRVPRNLPLRLRRAELLHAKGDHAGALALLRALANEYPDAPDPLRLWVRHTFQQKTLDPDETLEVLTRLRRVVRDETERRSVDGWIDAIHKRRAEVAAAARPEGAGPVQPTPELFARLLDEGELKVRREALLYLLNAPRVDFSIRPPLIQALLKRTSVQYETDPELRALALRVFGRFPSPETAPLVRIPLADRREPDLRVRMIAADVLGDLKNPLGIAALAQAATLSDAEYALAGVPAAPAADLRRAARYAIYQLARTAPPVAPDEPPEAHEAAFAAWWAGLEARDAKLRALEAAEKAAEVRPWELAFPLALDADPAVWPAAYRFLRRVAHQAKGHASSGPSAAFAVFMGRLPAFEDDALVPARRDEVAGALRRWWEGRPQ